MTETRKRGPYARQPHPQEAQIRALLEEGLTNSEVRRRLYVGEKAVATIRKAAGIPPAPRSAWRRRPHPDERAIRVLLDEGHTDAEIGRRVNADVSTIARIRREGGFGPATIRTRPPRKHPKDAEIRALLGQMSSEAIARKLRVDRVAVRRIRRQAGIMYVPPTFTTAEEKWEARVRPVDGGHLEWTGERGSPSGTPVMRFREKSYSPAAIAFRQRTGRDPVGQVRAECEFKHCIAPAHVDDEPGRIRTRKQLRYLTGGTERRPYCRHGHDQAEHGRYEPDGTAYCEVCKREQKRARCGQAAGGCG
ncbi:hypothetical protein [Streptomyces halobius]|uniref:Uncharacterized protein n=1 Tax=Streptomyces halobius TaxID=2879846 RepID=A0ABY4MHB6_9ACTN|nr:hypothetical protein [Streptomyces halobius]UQA95716.1 hypothetical protein K9S39_31070 [Streptomyces halobius]